MTSKVLLPSLSENGWIDSPVTVSDALFSHFLLSDYSQTYLYKDQVSSLPWIIQDTQGNISDTIIATQDTLSKYFIRYFDNVVVEVTEIPNIAEPSKGQISIYLQFTDTEGVQHVLGRLITIIDSKISEIISINNGV